MSINLDEQIQVGVEEPNKIFSRHLSLLDVLGRWVPFLNIIIGLFSLVLSLMLFVNNDFESYAIPALVIICLAFQIMLFDIYRQKKILEIKVALHTGLAYLFVIILYLLPNYFVLGSINAIFHCSLVGAISLLILGTIEMMDGLFYFMGASPSAEDISRYPLILVPIVITISIYIVLIAQLVINGASHFDWSIYTTPYSYYTYPVKKLIAGDWPVWSSELQQSVGIQNHLLGTGLLMLMTTLISLPIGTGAGIYLSEYSIGSFGSITRFVITALRSISFMILGFAAVSLVNISSGTPFAFLFKGYHFDGFSWVENGGGTFFTASLILSLVVIPVIARATEEGCRSLPQELREGSFALGSSEGYTLWRIVLPWSLPNIVTGVLLGCAEAAGDAAILLFIAGRGDFGVGPFSQVTALSYLVFDVWSDQTMFHDMFQQYQYTVGLLLILITVGLGVIALILKNYLIKRHRGG